MDIYFIGSLNPSHGSTISAFELDTSASLLKSEGLTGKAENMKQLKGKTFFYNTHIRSTTPGNQVYVCHLSLDEKLESASKKARIGLTLDRSTQLYSSSTFELSASSNVKFLFDVNFSASGSQSKAPSRAAQISKLDQVQALFYFIFDKSVSGFLTFLQQIKTFYMSASQDENMQLIEWALTEERDAVEIIYFLKSLILRELNKTHLQQFLFTYADERTCMVLSYEIDLLFVIDQELENAMRFWEQLRVAAPDTVFESGQGQSNNNSSNPAKAASFKRSLSDIRNQQSNQNASESKQQQEAVTLSKKLSEYRVRYNRSTEYGRHRYSLLTQLNELLYHFDKENGNEKELVNSIRQLENTLRAFFFHFRSEFLKTQNFDAVFENYLRNCHDITLPLRQEIFTKVEAVLRERKFFEQLVIFAPTLDFALEIAIHLYNQREYQESFLALLKRNESVQNPLELISLLKKKKEAIPLRYYNEIVKKIVNGAGSTVDGLKQFFNKFFLEVESPEVLQYFIEVLNKGLSLLKDDELFAFLTECIEEDTSKDSFFSRCLLRNREAEKLLIEKISPKRNINEIHKILLNMQLLEREGKNIIFRLIKNQQGKLDELDVILDLWNKLKSSIDERFQEKWFSAIKKSSIDAGRNNWNSFDSFLPKLTNDRGEKENIMSSFFESLNNTLVQSEFISRALEIREEASELMKKQCLDVLLQQNKTFDSPYALLSFFKNRPLDFSKSLQTEILQIVLEKHVDYLPYEEREFFTLESQENFRLYEFLVDSFLLQVENFSFFKDVQGFLANLGKRISLKNISFQELQLVKSLNERNFLKQRLSLVSQATKQAALNSSFLMSCLIEALELADETREKLFIYESFLKNYLIFYKEAYEKECKKTNESLANLPNYYVSEFKLPVLYVEHKSLIEYFYKAQESLVFQTLLKEDVYETDLASSGAENLGPIKKNDSDIAEIFLSLNSLEGNFKAITLELVHFLSESVSVSTLLKYYKHIDKIDKELKCLLELFGERERKEIDQFGELLRLYFCSDIKSMAELIVALVEFLQKQSTPILLGAVKERLDKIASSDITCKDYFTLMKELRALIEKFVPEQNFRIFIKEFSLSKETFDFLKDKKEEDISILVEYLDENEVSTQLLGSIGQAVDLMLFIGKLNIELASQVETDSELFSWLLEKYHSEKQHYIKLSSYMRQVRDFLPDIKDIYLRVTDKEGASRAKIAEMNKRVLITIQIRAEKYVCRFSFGNKPKEIVEDFEDLREMRDKCLIAGYDSKTRPVSFIDFVTEVETLMEVVSDLYNTGNPELPQKIELEVENFEKNFVEKEVKFYRSMQKTWSRNLNLNLREKFSATFYYGGQIRSLFQFFKYFRDAPAELICSSLFLLRFISGDYLEHKVEEIEELLKTADFKNLLGLDTSRSLDLVSGCVESLVQHWTGSKEGREMDIKKELEDYYHNDIFIVSSKSGEPEKVALATFLTITGKLPDCRNILLCHGGSSCEQIYAFLHRFYTCKQPSIFAIVQPENLAQSTQTYFEDKFLELYAAYSLHLRARFVIITANVDSLFIQCLKKAIKYKFDIPKDKKIDTKFPVKIVKSQLSGVGKSFSIQEGARASNLKYFYFPISGNIKLIKIVERFKALKIAEKSLLHIDIEEVIPESEDVLNNIIFSLIILGGLFYTEDIFYLPSDLSIRIEISSTPKVTKQCRFLEYINVEIQTITEDSFELTLNSEAKTNAAYLTTFMQYLKENLINDLDVFDHKVFRKPIAKVREYISPLLSDDIKTFYQKNCFINLLTYRLRLFSKSLPCCVLDNIGKNTRVVVVEHLIKNSRDFVKLHSTDPFESQVKNLELFENKLPSLDKFVRQNSQNTISFSKLGDEHLFLMFDRDNKTLFPIQKNVNLIPPELINIFKTKMGIKNVKHHFNYSIKTHEDLVLELQLIMGKSREKIDTKGYVITPDNFLKIILIYLKVKSGFPVIMMGETGCGKTSLLRCLVEVFLEEELKVILFHSGLTDDKLIAEINLLNEKSLKTNKQFWVFLDEINTSDCQGLVAEMLTKRSINGFPLSKNMNFIAAANPFRFRSGKLSVGLKKKEDNDKMGLAYLVKPIPFSLLNFVFDFGTLPKTDEARYIESILVNSNIMEPGRTKELILSSQKFIRETEGECSSVSLRDIKRFTIIYNWFLQQKTDRSAHSDKQGLHWESVILSLYVCYYFKLDSLEVRSAYLSHMEADLNGKIAEIDGNLKFNMKEIYEKEVDFYLRNMILERGIAKNTALKENIFINLVCICNKIPVIICGKPGCSKTLSVKLISNNLKGKGAKNPFFQKLPKVHLISYQGSLSSTSEEIERIFLKAYKINEDLIRNKENGTVVVFFDELGLAEISKNNPLKILHGLLEPDRDDPRQHVGFLGISNWRLDASKLNRVVFLGKPEPNVNDLKETAIEIGKSFNIGMRRNVLIHLEEIAECYHDYKEILRENRFDDNFHGTRDFYSCVKYVARNFAEEEKRLTPEGLSHIISRAICRNFGGLSNPLFDSLSQMIGLIERKELSFTREDIPTFELVKESLEDPESRYLMLLSRSDSALEMLEQIIKSTARSKTRTGVLIGSHFEDDIDNEDYIFSLLGEVIDAMEKGHTLIFQNLSQIYPSLYGLFNQIFTEVSNS